MQRKVSEGSHRGGVEIGNVKVGTCTPTSVYPSSLTDCGVKYFITLTAITQHGVKSNDTRKLHVRHWNESISCAQATLTSWGVLAPSLQHPLPDTSFYSP